MRKLILILVSLILVGCVGTGKDGSRYFTLGDRGDLLFYQTASRAEIALYEQEQVERLSRLQVWELCSRWDEVYNSQWRENIRGLISRALIAKGTDPLYCRNPVSDQIKSDLDKIRQEKSQRELRESSQRIIEENRRRQAEDELNRIRTDPNYRNRY